MTAFGPTLLSKVLGPQRHPGVQPRPGLPLRRPGRPAAPRPRRPARRRRLPHQRRGQARPQGARRTVVGDRGRDPARADHVPGPGRRRVLRRAGVRVGRPAADDRRRQGRDLAGRAAQPAGPAGGVLDVPDVAARGPLPRPPGGRRHRQAQAGLLLRRGAPALRRRLQGLPRPDRADRAADPLQGRRRLLRDPEPHRRTRRRARPARLAGPAPAPRAHPQRRQGAQGDRQHLPPQRVRRPRPGDHQPRHRRGRGHGDERARCADARWPGPGCAPPSR